MKCPLLKKYEVTDEDTQGDNPSGDWAKDICSLYCPLDYCVEDTGRISKIDKILLETVNVPLKVSGRLVCRQCGGFLELDRDEDKKLKCVNCGRNWNKPREE